MEGGADLGEGGQGRRVGSAGLEGLWGGGGGGRRAVVDDDDGDSQLEIAHLLVGCFVYYSPLLVALFVVRGGLGLVRFIFILKIITNYTKVLIKVIVKEELLPIHSMCTVMSAVQC